MNASTQVDSNGGAFSRIDQVIKTGHQTVSQSSRVQCLDNSLGYWALAMGLILHACCVCAATLLPGVFYRHFRVHG